MREAIRIGRESGLTTNLGHIKAFGVDVWGYADSVLASCATQRAAGHMVAADPVSLDRERHRPGRLPVPRWAEAGGATR